MPADLESKLDAITDKLEAKLESIQKFRLSLEAEADMCKAEAKRLTDRAKAKLAKSESLKEYIKHCMLLVSIQKVKTALFSFSLGETSSIDVPDINALPECYRRVETSISANKELIKTDMAGGANVPPGVEVKTGWKLTVR